MSDVSHHGRVGSPMTTRGEVVGAAIRADILNGRLAPGSKLAFAELARRYGASTGVLREVLPRLVEQGLATSQPQLGYRVVTLSVQELEHLTEARVAMETQVLRQSIRCGDLDWEAEVVAVHHRLSQIPNYVGLHELNEQWLSTHRRFHRVLLEGCPNPALRDVAERLRTVAEVYHCWSIRETTRLAERDDEHRRIAEAAVAHDEERAVEALTEHIQKTTALLIQARQVDTAREGVAGASDTPAAGL